MNAMDERIILIQKIFSQNITQEEVLNELNRIEKQYGENAFVPFSFQPEKKPWTNKYLNKLENLSISGASSKEFILHIAEVKQELHKRKIIKYTLFIAFTILILIIVFYFIK